MEAPSHAEEKAEGHFFAAGKEAAGCVFSSPAALLLPPRTKTLLRKRRCRPEEAGAGNAAEVEDYAETEKTKREKRGRRDEGDRERSEVEEDGRALQTRTHLQAEPDASASVFPCT
ncbi:UNVERIFIED_CONTAM: hypothetical protein HHA_263160 [Hammondia hammondi]|eukprot:XP_008887375.1 hypothetical protein HHA_263160 [Hammondia hammondi]